MEGSALLSPEESKEKSPSRKSVRISDSAEIIEENKTSLESRDNPFLPGSPLAKETDDLLKRATIIRDKFYLDKDGNRVETPASPNGLREKGDQLADNAKAVEEEVVASVQQEVNQAAAPTSPSKENGKVNELLKPESVKLDLNEKDQALDGNITDKPSSPKNKKKEKNKCCTIM